MYACVFYLFIYHISHNILLLCIPVYYLHYVCVMCILTVFKNVRLWTRLQKDSEVATKSFHDVSFLTCQYVLMNEYCMFVSINRSGRSILQKWALSQRRQLFTHCVRATARSFLLQLPWGIQWLQMWKYVNAMLNRLILSEKYSRQI